MHDHHRRSRSRTGAAGLWAVAALTLAAAPAPLFGPPVAVKEDALDRQFSRSALARELAGPAHTSACATVTRGLLAALADAAPALDARREDFALDPRLVARLEAQLSTPRFSATRALGLMVRRVRLDGKLPEPWLDTAQALAPDHEDLLDLAPLRLTAERLALVDSLDFTLDELDARYDRALAAPKATARDVLQRLKEDVLPRTVAWDGLRLEALRAERPTPKAPEQLVAVLVAHRADGRAVRVQVKLHPRQFLDLETLAVGDVVRLQGRLYELEASPRRYLVADGSLFVRRAWETLDLGSPALVDACPAAVDPGTVERAQPGGFAH